MFFNYRCPQCGRMILGDGKFGHSTICECGKHLSAKFLDKIRIYWILQIAISYGIATLFLVLALFQPYLPVDPWERLFSPILISPAFASAIVIYRTLTKYKKSFHCDDLLFKYYLLGIGLLAFSFMLALVVARL